VRWTNGGGIGKRVKGVVGSTGWGGGSGEACVGGGEGGESERKRE